jgi:hypothetical protein
MGLECHTAVPCCLILPLRSETRHTYKVLLIGVQKTLKYQRSGMVSDSGSFLWIFYTCRVNLKKYSYLILLYFLNLTTKKDPAYKPLFQNAYSLFPKGLCTDIFLVSNTLEYKPFIVFIEVSHYLMIYLRLQIF